MRGGGVFATSSAIAAVEPLKSPTSMMRPANTIGLGAKGTSVKHTPMPMVARSTMILRP
jgi:hypothetical protein